MASCQTDCCNFIRGEVFIADASASCSSTVSGLLGCKSGKAPMRKIGNVETLSLAIESEIRGLTSKVNFLETLSCATTVINNVGLSMTVNCIDKENLKLGLFGTSEELSDSGSIVDERFCGELKACYFLRTQKCGISNLVLEVKDSSGSVVFTLVEDQDYKVDDFGFELMTTINLPAGQFLFASYDYNESDITVTQPLVQSKGPFNLYFKGTNLNGKAPYHVELFRVVLQPVNLFEIISGDNFQSFQFNGTLMRDCTRENGLSQYMELKQGVSNGDNCN